jgi:hypothetical protein
LKKESARSTILGAPDNHIVRGIRDFFFLWQGELGVNNVHYAEGKHKRFPRATIYRGRGIFKFSFLKQKDFGRKKKGSFFEGEGGGGTI